MTDCPQGRQPPRILRHQDKVEIEVSRFANLPFEAICIQRFDKRSGSILQIVIVMPV
jgi:hypothetical protein